MRLDTRRVRRGVSVLIRRDKHLRRIVRTHGTPPLWARKPGFATLVRIILEQQVSLASGKAMFGKIRAKLVQVTPRSVVQSGVKGLRRIGVTRQKAGYCVDLAQNVLSGGLNLRRLSGMDDEKVRRTNGKGEPGR